MTQTEADLAASDVAWDLEPLVDGRGAAGVDAALECLEQMARVVDWLCDGCLRSRGIMAVQLCSSAGQHVNSATAPRNSANGQRADALGK